MLSEKDNKTRIPYEHYKQLYSKANPQEISERTNIPYDSLAHTFNIRLLGEEYTLSWPDFVMKSVSGEEYLEYTAIILIARYLLEGKYTPCTDKKLSYTDMPAGNLYYEPFKGRCLMRLAYAFGFKLDLFAKAMEKIGAEKVDMGDVGYKYELINGFYMYMGLWAADEDFGPSSQILYSDNFPDAFTTEDMAVCGDISIATVKKIASGI